jgi:hypothetical protein
MHPASDPVWFAAGITEGLLRGGVKAGAETAIENSVAKQLTFQTEHIMRTLLARASPKLKLSAASGNRFRQLYGERHPKGGSGVGFLFEDN